LNWYNMLEAKGLVVDAEPAAAVAEEKLLFAE
jgi:hypothetical protein